MVSHGHPPWMWPKQVLGHLQWICSKEVSTRSIVPTRSSESISLILTCLASSYQTPSLSLISMLRVCWLAIEQCSLALHMTDLFPVTIKEARASSTIYCNDWGGMTEVHCICYRLTTEGKYFDSCLESLWVMIFVQLNLRVTTFAISCEKVEDDCHPE